MESSSRCSVWVGHRDRGHLEGTGGGSSERGEDSYLATREDIELATREDFFMATDMAVLRRSEEHELRPMSSRLLPTCSLVGTAGAPRSASCRAKITKKKRIANFTGAQRDLPLLRAGHLRHRGNGVRRGVALSPALLALHERVIEDEDARKARHGLEEAIRGARREVERGRRRTP